MITSSFYAKIQGGDCFGANIRITLKACVSVQISCLLVSATKSVTGGNAGGGDITAVADNNRAKGHFLWLGAPGPGLWVGRFS